MIRQEKQYIAFAGTTRIAAGPLSEVARAAKGVIDRGDSCPVLIFDAVTSEQLEVDFRGSVNEVVGRLLGREQSGGGGAVDADEDARRSPGRPKLGVIAREVTLLPRHWDWLAQQPGGASVTLRMLVEHAKRSSGDADRVRVARESTYRFMSAMAGNEPGFEEAARALFAGKQDRFFDMIRSWPPDLREHVAQLARPGLGNSEPHRNPAPPKRE